MEIINKNNRTYLSLKNEHGDVLPFQAQIYATSGSGKGIAEENLIEKWRKATNGIVLVIADPKDEAEFTFVQYLPEKRYHLEFLKEKGKLPQTYPCKVYHPYTSNIPKGYLPPINFYTVPIKTLTREDWTILAETTFDSESIKLLLRVSEDLGRNDGLFLFLHEIQRRVQGKKDKKKMIPDPKNFYLNVGSGTAKSITEVANLLSPFKTNYFLRKETCPYALNWEEILTDNKNYHIFLSMWLKDEKLKEFCVLNLLKQIISNRHFSKKPILIIIPEIRKLTPRNPQGYKYFLSEAITEALVTMRSQGKGISSICDSQNWSDTDDKIKGSATITFIGQLSTKDGEVVCKALNYKRDYREQLQNMKRNAFFIYGHEDYDPFLIFFPSHMHKEPEYNWIEMYKKNFSDKMVRYDELVRFMNNEYEKEEEVKLKVKKIQEQEEKEAEEKKQERELRKEDKEKPKKQKEDKNLQIIKEQAYKLKQEGKSFRAIGKELKINHVTAQKYIKAWEKNLEEENKPESIENMIGLGIMPEEVDSNF